jgi:hypothetical protein
VIRFYTCSTLAVAGVGCAHAHDAIVVRWARSDEFHPVRTTEPTPSPAPTNAAAPLTDEELREVAEQESREEVSIPIPSSTEAGCLISGPIVRSYYKPIVELMRSVGLAGTPADTRLVDHVSSEIVHAANTRTMNLIVEPRREVGEAVVVEGARLKLYCLRAVHAGTTTTIIVDEFFHFGEP